jgi:hypothetical protein
VNRLIKKQEQPRERERDAHPGKKTKRKKKEELGAIEIYYGIIYYLYIIVCGGR